MDICEFVENRADLRLFFLKFIGYNKGVGISCSRECKERIVSKVIIVVFMDFNVNCKMEINE